MKKGEKMKKNTKIFGIGATILILTLSISPVVYADPTSVFQKVWSDCEDILLAYNSTIEELNEYIEDYIDTYGELNHTFAFTPELQADLNNIFDELNDILEEEDLETLTYYEPPIEQYETLEQMLENETELPAPGPSETGGKDDWEADWFVELTPIAGFGFWIDAWMSHETVQEMDEEANRGFLELGIFIAIFALTCGGAAGTVVPFCWLFAVFIIGDLMNEIENTDEGMGFIYIGNIIFSQ